MRILALDVGDRRIGIALSDSLRIIAGGLDTYHRVSESADIKHILDICNKEDVYKIVVGLPINLDSTDSIQTEKTREFVDILKQQTDLQVVFLDERLTSVQAGKVLELANSKKSRSRPMTEKDKKQYLDKIAATILLQNYLDYHEVK